MLVLQLTFTERYKCYHWNSEDKANIAKRGEEVDYCYQKGAGFRHTRGDNSKAPVVGPVGAASLILIVINATTGMKPRRNGLGEVRMR